MAYTRIHAIKSTVTKAVAYICNPDKTEQQLLVDSFGCSPETARHDFDYALSRTKQSDKNQAYHLIQSFAKGEVSHEEAHRIGIELADKLLGGKYSYVVATHTDKGHPHNHIIFCAADNIDHKKYNACKKSYYHIRQLSDELCKEHSLSIIEPSGRKGKKYIQWKAEQEGTSWKKRLQEDIDECIRIAKSYEDFLRLIKEKGYTVTGDKIGDPHAKYIKFTAPGQERPVRGSFRNFGAGYTKEEIKDRIENPEKWQNKEQTVQEPNTTEAPKQKSRIKIPKKDILTRTSASRTLIDTSGEKFQNSPGLQHWASVKNLKTAAASYAAADNLSELQKQIDKKTTEAKSARTELVELEHQMKKSPNCFYMRNSTETINLFKKNIRSPRIRTDTSVCTKHSSSYMMVLNVCFGRWGLTQNPLIRQRYALTMMLCRLVNPYLRKHINQQKTTQKLSNKKWLM